jgi:hypothetical protein
VKRSKLTATVSVLVVVGMLAASLSLASATPSSPVTGAWKPNPATIEFTNGREAGANTFVDVYVKGNYYTGDIIGAFEQNFKTVAHFESPEAVENRNPANPASWPVVSFDWTRMVRSFTGTVKVDGIVYSGGLTIKLEAHGLGNTLAGPSGFELSGTWVIMEGTGGLAGLHGQGTWWHTRGSTAGFEYEGQVHFDP